MGRPPLFDHRVAQVTTHRNKQAFELLASAVERGVATEMQLLKAAAHLYRAKHEAEYFESSEGEIESGIFKGLKYTNYALCSALMPKILGSYESELAPALAAIFPTIDTFLQVGCAEGYYVVGAARVFGVPLCMGVDIDASSGLALAELAQKNGVQRRVSFYQDLHDALRFLKGRQLVLLDVEGAEEKVLELLASVSSAGSETMEITLVIETDFHYDEEFDTPLRSNSEHLIRAAKVHGFSLQDRIRQDPNNRFVPATQDYSFIKRATLTDEGRRPGQEWLILHRD